MRTFLLGLALLALPAAVHGQEQEPSAIVELGGAGQWGVKGGTSFGPNVGVETTPIPEILEIEGDITPFFGHGQTEWDSDILFKKPFDLSRSLEFMAGVGPEWEHSVSHGKIVDSAGAEAGLDFMYWPTADHRLGWYLEPSYGYSFAGGHEQSLGVSTGLLIPIP